VEDAWRGIFGDCRKNLRKRFERVAPEYFRRILAGDLDGAAEHRGATGVFLRPYERFEPPCVVRVPNIERLEVEADPG